MPSKIGLTFIWFIHHHFDHHCHHRCRPPHHHLHHFDIFIPQCCGPARPFDMNITDNTGMEVVIINIDITFVWSAINVTLHLSKCIFTFSWQRWFTWTDPFVVKPAASHAAFKSLRSFYHCHHCFLLSSPSLLLSPSSPSLLSLSMSSFVSLPLLSLFNK